MAGRRVTSSGGDGLISSVAVSAAPLTMACWFKARDVTANHTLMGCFDDGTGNTDAFYLSASGAIGGDPIRAVTVANSAFEFAVTGIGYVAERWTHAAGVFASATHRVPYINGIMGVPAGNSRTPTGVVRSLLGVYYGSGAYVYANTDVCEAGLWNVGLSDLDIKRLAAGARCSDVRPDALVGYWLPVDEYDLGDIGERNVASGGYGPAFPITTGSARRPTDLPRICAPTHRIVRVPPYVGGGGVSIPPLFRRTPRLAVSQRW